MKINFLFFIALFLVLTVFAPVTFAIPLADLPVYNDDTGNYYNAISVDGWITWEDAKIAAEEMTFMGMQGHLAVITDAMENQFIVDNFPLILDPDVGGYWIGGFQPGGSAEPDGNWKWVTGEDFDQYTNWSDAEPNDFGTGENALHFNRFIPGGNDGTWNDLPKDGFAAGFIVEFSSTPVPEPATLSLLSLGLIGLFCLKRRMK